MLAETTIELKLRKVKDVNSVASSILGRSSQAIQKIRTRPEYKTVEDHTQNKT